VHVLKGNQMGSRVKNLYLTLIAYLVATVISYGKYVQGDFSIYFTAGKRITRNLSVYETENNLYVYGPLLAHLLAPFSAWDDLLASRTWLVLSVLAIAFSAMIFCRDILKIVRLDQIVFSLSILCISFATRNNLGNGNVMAFVLLGVVLSISLILRNENYKNAIILSLVTLFIFEVKTYIALFLILFLLISKKFKTLLIFLTFLCIFNFLYFKISQVTYVDWIHSLKARSIGLNSGSDQATILVFLNKLTSDSYFIGLIFAMLAYFLLLARMFKSLSRCNGDREIQGIILLAASPVITIFSHGQDFIVSTLVLVYLLLKHNYGLEITKNLKVYLFLALGLLVNWTNEQAIFALPVLVALGLALAISAMPNQAILMVVIINVISLIVSGLLFSQEGDIQYVFYNFQALAFGLSIFLAITSKKFLKLVSQRVD
jgi:hypothetical protein